MTMMKIWKDNRRKVHWIQIWSLILILIQIPIPIQLFHIPPSPTSPPFLVSIPALGGHRYPWSSTPSSRFRFQHDLPVPQLCTFHWLVVFFVSIAALPLIRFRRIVWGVTFLLPFLPLLFLCGFTPSPLHIFLPCLPHVIPWNISPHPGPLFICLYWHRWTSKRITRR